MLGAKKEIRNPYYIGFALRHSVICQEIPRHPLNQPVAKLNPVATWSPAFSRAFYSGLSTALCDTLSHSVNNNADHKITVHLDRWKSVTLPESTESRSGPNGTEVSTDVTSLQFSEISHRFKIKPIIFPVSFCQSHFTSVRHKSCMRLKFDDHRTTSTTTTSDWYQATKSD